MNDLATIFATDPLELTKRPEDLDAIIAYYREARKRYVLGDKAAGKPAKKKTEKLDVNLDDLGL